MSQNTHNVRTRREQLATYPESVCVGRYSGDTWQLELDSDDLDADRLVEGPVLYVRCDIAHRSQAKAEERAKSAEIAGYIPDNTPNFFAASGAKYTSTALHREPFPGYIPVYYAPANVAALEGGAAFRDVIAERERQKTAEGWTEAHDDTHDSGEMASAAAAYAYSAGRLSGAPPTFWPWDKGWWKPTTARRDLVKAAALILAEIERLDRAALTREGDQA